MRHDDHTTDHTFVPTCPVTVADRLPDHLDLEGVRIRFTARPGGDATDRWRTPVSWQRGRRRGTGSLEVRRAGHGWSELELHWDATGSPPRRPARRRRPAGGRTIGGDRSAADRSTVGALERRITGRPVPRPTPPTRSRPAIGRRVAAAATTALALLVALVVVVPLGGATPVADDDVLARFRAAADDTPAGAAHDEPRATDPAPEDDPALARGGEDDDASTTPPPAEPAGGATPATDPAATSPRASDAAAATGATGPAAASPQATTNERRPAPADPADERAVADRPAEGVYRYTTDGWEELDARGSHRRFPEETVQTVLHTDAGFRQVWEPIEERRDEHHLSIATDPPSLVTTDTSRSFFGQRRTQRFTCAPADTRPEGWTVRCDDGAGTAMTVTTVTEGTERRTVAGQEVEVVRARVTAQLTGETEGRRTSTVWTRATDGLLVRSEVRADLDAPGPFGRVRYREETTLHLAALEPQR